MYMRIILHDLWWNQSRKSLIIIWQNDLCLYKLITVSLLSLYHKSAH